MRGFHILIDLSRRKWSPATTAMANFVAIDGPPGPTMAAMDGPLCRREVVPP